MDFHTSCIEINTFNTKAGSEIAADGAAALRFAAQVFCF
jgi:hypothetical protein